MTFVMNVCLELLRLLFAPLYLPLVMTRGSGVGIPLGNMVVSVSMLSVLATWAFLTLRDGRYELAGAMWLAAWAFGRVIEWQDDRYRRKLG